MSEQNGTTRMQLDSKVAVVTGAASGIGHAVAELFLGEGARVVLADSNVAGLHDATERLRGLGWETLSAKPTNVADADDMAALFAHATQEFGGLDVIVNNAGVQRSGPIETYDDAMWDLMMGVNPRSCYLAAKHGVPALRARGGGAIVNVASLAALNGGPGQSGYAASKGAIVALSRSLANELAPENIRVNALCPGWVDTPFNQPAIDFMGGDERLAEVVRTGVPMQRMSTPEEIAKSVLFLASDASSYMTGEALVVAGGAR
ncbi:SDR family NAD(P)-dependent oxidoreductase [Saccharopolyspora spinosa]|uniref:NAD(P)-dependent dehydrogenase (Short-subunit alcohol dehydrogenase family) n=2 Tax=Saccharopolyspora spinosa TaxID=60894 RepID=A0A2N3Y6J6_SACSN|nr:NAD(P)-dependent dehydrogenase (short-subunit alcohol dehydrogenase family) [Saccharopolyspora spinosa]